MNKVKIIYSFIFSLFVAATLALPVYADPAVINPCPNSTQSGTNTFDALCPQGTFNQSKVGEVISKTIVILLIVAVVTAVVFLIIGGIRWILSGGDKTKVEEARKQIVAAIIGLVVAFVAFFLINFVGSLFGVSLTSIQIPTFTNIINGK